MLALGSDKPLQALAVLEKKDDKTLEDMVALGDRWKAAEHKDRAVFWYKQALPNASGLVKVRLEKEVAAWDASGATSVGGTKQYDPATGASQPSPSRRRCGTHAHR